MIQDAFYIRFNCGALGCSEVIAGKIIEFSGRETEFGILNKKYT